MAEKSSSRFRLDDFVAAVHADPAAVEPTVLLAGYLGRSSEEGNVRVYLDPGLSSWLEVPEAEVIHSRPIADSPLGGSQLWVRASAQIKPGAPGAAAAPEGEEGGGDKGAVGSDTGVFNPMATIHPTLWTQFCPTGVACLPTIPCLPPSIGCPQQGPIGPTGWHTCACPATQLGCPNTVSCPPAGQVQGGPTGWYTCVCPVGPTGTQGCGQGGLGAVGPTGTQGCTVPPHCFGPTGTQGCGQGGLGAVGPTGTQGCTQPGHCVGQTGWHTCACPIGPTGYQGCGQGQVGMPGPTGTQGCTQPPHCVGPTGTQGCGAGQAAGYPNDPTASTMCFICPPITLDPTAATRCFICPPMGAANFAPAAQPLGPTGTQGCTQPPHCVGPTGWHTCACPIGPTGYQGCGGAQARDMSFFLCPGGTDIKCDTLFAAPAAAYPPGSPTAATRCFICPPLAAAGPAAAAQLDPTQPTQVIPACPSIVMCLHTWQGSTCVAGNALGAAAVSPTAIQGCSYVGCYQTFHCGR